MRFRLATGPQGSRQIADSFGQGMDSLFQAPLLAAQGAEEAQTADMKRRALQAQTDEAAAHAALFGTQADEKRTQLERGGLGELLKTAALQQGVPLSQLGEATDYLSTGQLAGKYQLPADQQGPILPAPQYADPALGARIMQSLGLSRQALTVGDKSVENIAKATGEYQKQGDVRAAQANPGNAGIIGQSYAAVDGKPLINNIGNTGRGFNQFTGDGGTLSSGVAALYDKNELAQVNQRNAAAGASAASADHSRAETRKLNFEIEQGVRTGDIQLVPSQDGSLVAVNKRTLQVQPLVGADGKPVIRGGAGGGGKPLTGDQAKANLFGARMMESDKTLADLEDKGVANTGVTRSIVQGTVGLLPFIGDKLSEAAGSGMNVLPTVLGGPSSDQQRVDQARRDFVNAVLRRESGAAISQSEFDNANKQYFPQPGDGKAVKEQKRRNRQIAMTLMLQEVPEAQRYKPGAVPPATPPALPQSGGASGSWGAPGGGWAIQRVN